MIFRSHIVHFFAAIWLLSGSLTATELDFSDLEATETDLESLVAAWQQEWAEEEKPETARELAFSLHALGIVERQAAKPQQALDHLSRACELLQEHAPQWLPDALEAKALTLQDLGELIESERLLREVLLTRRQSDEPSVLAATLDHLALNLLYQGQYTAVASIIDEALNIAPATDTALRARLLGHRGRLYHTLGSHSRASKSFRAALALPFRDPEQRLALESQLALAQLRLGHEFLAREGIEAVAETARTLFAETPFKAVPYLSNLGSLSLAQGDLEAAHSSFFEALQILESTFGPDHPSLISPLNNLGVAAQSFGDYTIAKAYLERAASLQAKHLPPTHLRVAETTRNLARNALLSKAPDARTHVEHATALGLDLLDQLIRNGSEQERLNFLERLDLLSLPCAIGDPELIANTLLASKARLLDAMLADSKPGQRMTWQDVQASLAPGTAFIDACRFYAIGPSPRDEYGAIVLLPEGPPQWVKLGSAEELRNQLKSFRERLVWRSATLAGKANAAPPVTLQATLRLLYQGFWEPIAARLPATSLHLAFSPAGSLHFLPLAALLDSDGQPLCKRYLQIATLTSGRDLLLPAPSLTLTAEPWTVITVSDFPKSTTQNTGDPLLTMLSELRPMPGTRDEAEKLRQLAPPGSTFLSGSEASESALTQLPRPPGVLHLGSHAFFLTNETSNDAIPLDFDERSDLLFSGGLVLYQGTKRSLDSPRISSSDDLLFPTEIAQLQLNGTRLVTLSSCESGIGTPVSGEGILGLRRAFSIAGAREIVVALWPVSDDSTPHFMQRFYQRALASDRPAQALWQTQQEFLSTADGSEQFELAVLRYAPFVLSQNTPLITGSKIPTPPQLAPPSRLDWRLIAIGAATFIAFILAHLSRKKRRG